MFGGPDNDIVTVGRDPAADVVDCGDGDDFVFFSTGDAINANCETTVEVPQP